MDMSVACPEGYEPNEEVIKKAEKLANENNAKITITSDIKEAVSNSDAIYTDVWVSMG